MHSTGIRSAAWLLGCSPKRNDAAPVVWCATDNIDITKQLMKAYNLKSGAGVTNVPDKPAANRPEGAISKKP